LPYPGIVSDAPQKTVPDTSAARLRARDQWVRSALDAFLKASRGWMDDPSRSIELLRVIIEGWAHAVGVALEPDFAPYQKGKLHTRQLGDLLPQVRHHLPADLHTFVTYAKQLADPLHHNQGAAPAISPRTAQATLLQCADLLEWLHRELVLAPPPPELDAALATLHDHPPGRAPTATPLAVPSPSLFTEPRPSPLSGPATSPMTSPMSAPPTVPMSAPAVSVVSTPVLLPWHGPPSAPRRRPRSAFVAVLAAPDRSEPCSMAPLLTTLVRGEPRTLLAFEVNQGTAILEALGSKVYDDWFREPLRDMETSTNEDDLLATWRERYIVVVLRTTPERVGNRVGLWLRRAGHIGQRRLSLAQHQQQPPRRRVLEGDHDVEIPERGGQLQLRNAGDDGPPGAEVGDEPEVLEAEREAAGLPRGPTAGGAEDIERHRDHPFRG
jgi:hypothetical protein